MKKAKTKKRPLRYQGKKRQASNHASSFSLRNILQQALALHQNGHLHEAEGLYRRILQENPEHPRALLYLGILAQDVGNVEVALELISRAVALQPDFAEAHNNLGILYITSGKLPTAVASFRQAVLCQPDYADAHNNLGNALKAQGNLEEAISCYRQALILQPDFPMAHFNLGSILHEQGRLEEAASSYRQALSLKPDYVEALNNLGNALKEQGNTKEAIGSFRQALTLKPDYVEAYNNLGIALKDEGMLEEAIISYRRALSLKPDYADIYNNLGTALREQGKLEEAIASHRQALTLKPDYAEASNNLGVALKDQGNIDEAITCFRRALALKPNFISAHSNLLFCLNYLPNQPVAQYLEEARRYGISATAMVKIPYSEWIGANRPQRLRVGLVSGDLRNHPVGYFLENMLAEFDPSQIELIAYPTKHGGDELTARIRPRFLAWKPMAGLNDAAAARLIHDDGVHILLDLAGHTGGNRLPVFAWKPAPIQAAWLGYFASTGLTEMDYFIADRVSVPETCHQHFTEKVWYLPETRLCFSAPATAKELPITALPALTNGCLTFGSFQNIAKLNDDVLAVWGRIMQKLPRARLRLQNYLLGSQSIREQLQKRLARNGIEANQVIFESPAPRQDYLAAHGYIDMILDTFPYPGGTTTCEALWMGVPTLTLAGDSMLARQGASLLACAGLHDWIAVDKEDYIMKAVNFATDLDRLSRVRTVLREKVLASPLFDGPGFARNFEAALWGMWRRLSADWTKS